MSNLDVSLVGQLQGLTSRLSQGVDSLDTKETDIARRLNSSKKLSFDASNDSLPEQLEQLEKRMSNWVELVCALKTGRLEDLQKRLNECREIYFAAKKDFGALKEKLKTQIESQKANNEQMTPIKERIKRCSIMLEKLTPQKNQPPFTDEK